MAGCKGVQLLRRAKRISRMARHGGSRHSADALAKAALAGLLLAGVGAISGILLGQFVAGERFAASSPAHASFAELSSNPDAVGADVLPASLCDGCAAGYVPPTRAFTAYGVDAFDPPEAVFLDYAPPPAAEDGYRYGGNFEDAAPPLPSAPDARAAGGPGLIVLSDDMVPGAPRPVAVPIPAASE
ncbi:hypothetical protein SAMN06295937_100668 [Sphingopyxis flava]|uniref:Uncharacterized protein n=2 Tax=Sphingopyxis flava TaxID=1507287 RepID=A0A1T5BBD4_9SPHN|nr:hypothetical protein SAMN06295937_100668 [Sphingopyxis flava]